MPLLDIQSLMVEYRTLKANVKAVDHVSLSVEKGETLGLVGESGCGKSTLGLSTVRLVPFPGKIVSGHITLDGIDVMSCTDEEIRGVRGKRVGYIFQDPMTSLNPVKRIGAHFVEMISTHEPEVSKEDALKRGREMLERLGIHPQRIDDFPHQFSGGMRQRVMIGLALALNPDLLIADEPTTSLDVIVEAQIIELLKNLKASFRLALVLITHNIGIVAETADRVAVMYAGKIAELSETEALFERPRHPYTQALLNSVPNVRKKGQILSSIPGAPPDLAEPFPGCPFHPRCPFAFDRCKTEEPMLMKHNSSEAACHLYDKR
ncbi:MAG: ABC transporter ATP-binding protein [Candidatus Bathyarchaeia archaeon]